MLIFFLWLFYLLVKFEVLNFFIQISEYNNIFISIFYLLLLKISVGNLLHFWLCVRLLTMIRIAVIKGTMAWEASLDSLTLGKLSGVPISVILMAYTYLSQFHTCYFIIMCLYVCLLCWTELLGGKKYFLLTFVSPVPGRVLSPQHIINTL